MTDPEMETNDQEMDGPTQHVEVAPPADEDAAGGPPPAAAPSGPRSYPQHYRLLFGAFCVMMGGMAVWQREHVFGMEIEGEDMISGNLLMILGGYSVLVGALNILTGRLAGMLAAFLCGLTALYFGIPGILATSSQDAYVSLSDIDTYISSEETARKIPDRFKQGTVEFPEKTIEGFTTKQDSWYYVIGQYAPGPIYTTLGGFLLIWVFAGAMFGGKKKSGGSEPPPAARRRRR